MVRFLSAHKLDGLLLNAQHNFAWLSCGGRNGIDLSRDPGAGTLLVASDGRRYILANNIEMRRLLSEVLNPDEWLPIEFTWEQEKANSALPLERARAVLGANALIAADFPCGDAQMIEGIFAPLRYQLTEPEMERFRSLGREAREAIGTLAQNVTPGMTELEVARAATDALAVRRAFAVVTLVAADDRLAKFRHPVPTSKTWDRVLMIVVCARRHGLIVSLTRIVCRGEVPKDLRAKTLAAAHVNARLFAATRPGARGSNLYAVAAEAYADEGFVGEERLHHQGGAAGYRAREWVVHPKSDEQVISRQAFAWNPSITGTKVEETCIAFADHCEIITASPGWPGIAVDMEEHSYLLPSVLSI